MDQLSIGVTTTNMLWVLFGVLVLWFKEGTRVYSPESFEEMLERIRVPEGLAIFLVSIVTIAVGVVVAAVFAEPQTPRQAIAAGLAWTGFLPPKLKGGAK